MLIFKTTLQLNKKTALIISALTINFLLFFFSSSSQNTVYTPLYNSGNFVKTVDFSKPVGEIAGNVSATASGGVTYSIPIFTSPGTNGLQPSISLTYNSQASSGVAGYGWNISGLSAISRTGKNIYHNGIVTPVTYTSADAFLLDGMRLNAISGANGGNGTIYAGEAESFAKIISYEGSFPNNPGWFQVTGGNVDDYRLGGFSFGYNGDFIGVNSEWVRHIGQNVIAHQWFAPQRAFKMLSISWSPYLPTFSFNSKYSLW